MARREQPTAAWQQLVLRAADGFDDLAAGQFEQLGVGAHFIVGTVAGVSDFPAGKLL